ncbi:MAG: stage II sporulation protein D [Clostridia bacterium]|nr:stage II sporulation protein D [Clostridia bacterium]
MRRFILYFLGFIFLFFIVPILFTVSFEDDDVKVVSANEVSDERKEEPNYNYREFNIIKLLHDKTGEIEEVGLEDYLVNVVSAEMPVSYEVEALKAQAVVARTYTIYKIIHSGKHDGADICDSSLCCQAWISKEDRLAKWDQDVAEENWNKIKKAVNDTKGKIITYDGEPINAFFHSNSGGLTEVPFNVWGGSGYPYLQVVETAGENEYSQGLSEVVLSRVDVENKMKERYDDFSINWDEADSIKVLELNESNRVRTLKVGNINISGVEARSIFGLKSANFEVIFSGDSIIFSVKGYGHRSWNESDW